MTKKYYFPHEQYIDLFYGSGEIVCIDEKAVNDYADELLRDYGAYENYPPVHGADEDEEKEFFRETVWSWFHEADEDEIAE